MIHTALVCLPVKQPRKELYITFLHVQVPSNSSLSTFISSDFAYAKNPIDQPGSIPRRCRRRPEALARPKARKGTDEHGNRAGQSEDARLVRWQRGPEAPNPHDVLHPRPRARPRGPHRQREGREARVGHEDDFEVLPMPREEHRLGTNQLEGRVPSRQVCNTGTRIASKKRSKQR